MDGLNTPVSITNESARDLRRRKEFISIGKEHQKDVSRAIDHEKLNISRLMAGDVRIRNMHTKP
jgi:hypothetical protein